MHLFQTLTCIQKRKCVLGHRGADVGKSMTFLSSWKSLGEGILKGARGEGLWFQGGGGHLSCLLGMGVLVKGLVCGLICCVQ